MEGWILLNQKHFFLEGNNTFSLYGVEFVRSESNGELDKRTEGSKIWEMLGLVFKSSLSNRPYFIRKDTFKSMSEIIFKADLSLKAFDYVFMFLWFVKDCSCNIDQVGVCLVDGSQAVIRSKQSMYSTAKGTYEDTEFTLQEIDYCIKLRDAYDDLSLKKTEQICKTEINPLEILVGEGSIKPYNDINRIELAYRFLSDARETTLLPAKISFYVLVLECLFSANDSTEIQHKISERVALYMGESGDHSFEIYKDIKIYYAIRSKYVHGQLLGNKFRDNESLAKHSVKLDSLIRSVLVKVITIDSHKFLLNDNALNDWFQTLLFRMIVRE